MSSSSSTSFLLTIVFVVYFILLPILIPSSLFCQWYSCCTTSIPRQLDAFRLPIIISSSSFQTQPHHIHQVQQQQRRSNMIWIPWTLRKHHVLSTRIDLALSSTSSSTSMPSSSTFTESLQSTIIIPNDALEQLHQQHYVIIPNFISKELQDELCHDIQTLRQSDKKYFKPANIGQDSTNTYNTSIRITETCFIGPDKTHLNTIEKNNARETLYKIVNDIGTIISSKLDMSMTELLYAYYPNGGYYRTHLDAIPGSISYLRQYSFLIYLNSGLYRWNTTTDGGQLRLYINQPTNTTTTTTMNNRNDIIPKQPIYDFTNDQYKIEYDTTIDVTPSNGTLVLFNSHMIPHEVLNTYRERYVIIGWYNRPISLSLDDYKNIIITSPTGSSSTTGATIESNRIAMLTVAIGMITFGVYNLMTSL